MCRSRNGALPAHERLFSIERSGDHVTLVLSLAEVQGLVEFFDWEHLVTHATPDLSLLRSSINVLASIARCKIQAEPGWAGFRVAARLGEISTLAAALRWFLMQRAETNTPPRLCEDLAATALARLHARLENMGLATHTASAPATAAALPWPTSDMENELARLATFTAWPHQQPQPADLARLGFYATPQPGVLDLCSHFADDSDTSNWATLPSLDAVRQRLATNPFLSGQPVAHVALPDVLNDLPPCAHPDQPVALTAYDPSGAWLATASLDGVVCLWDTRLKMRLCCITNFRQGSDHTATAATATAAASNVTTSKAQPPSKKPSADNGAPKDDEFSQLMVSHLVSMGFPKDQARAALDATNYKSVQDALDYLVGGQLGFGDDDDLGDLGDGDGDDQFFGTDDAEPEHLDVAQSAPAPEPPQAAPAPPEPPQAAPAPSEPPAAPHELPTAFLTPHKPSGGLACLLEPAATTPAGAITAAQVKPSTLTPGPTPSAAHEELAALAEPDMITPEHQIKSSPFGFDPFPASEGFTFASQPLFASKPATTGFTFSSSTTSTAGTGTAAKPKSSKDPAAAPAAEPVTGPAKRAHLARPPPDFALEPEAGARLVALLALPGPSALAPVLLAAVFASDTQCLVRLQRYSYDFAKLAKAFVTEVTAMQPYNAFSWSANNTAVGSWHTCKLCGHVFSPSVSYTANASAGAATTTPADPELAQAMIEWHMLDKHTNAFHLAEAFDARVQHSLTANHVQDLVLPVAGVAGAVFDPASERLLLLRDAPDEGVFLLAVAVDRSQHDPLAVVARSLSAGPNSGPTVKCAVCGQVHATHELRGHLLHEHASQVAKAWGDARWTATVANPAVLVARPDQDLMLPVTPSAPSPPGSAPILKLLAQGTLLAYVPGHGQHVDLVELATVTPVLSVDVDDRVLDLTLQPRSPDASASPAPSEPHVALLGASGLIWTHAFACGPPRLPAPSDDPALVWPLPSPLYQADLTRVQTALTPHPSPFACPQPPPGAVVCPSSDHTLTLVLPPQQPPSSSVVLHLALPRPLVVAEVVLSYQVQLGAAGSRLGDEPATEGETPGHEHELANGLLPLTLLSTDGGEHSSQYGAHNMLVDNSEVYCTKQPQATVVARHTQHHLMRIESVVVKSCGFGFTAPIGQGMIFVLDRPAQASKLSMYRSWDRHQYDAYLADKKATRVSHVKATEPVAFFSMVEGKTELVTPVDFVRTGRVVAIMLLRALTFNAENIDIRYVGLMGATVQRSAAVEHVPLPLTATLGPEPASPATLSATLVHQGRTADVTHTGSVVLRSPALLHSPAAAVKLTLAPHARDPQHDQAVWVRTVSLQVKVLCPRASVPTVMALQQLLNAPETLCAALLQPVHDPAIAPHRRLSALQLLSTVARLLPRTQAFVVEHVDLPQLLRVNLLSDSTGTCVGSVQALLQQLATPAGPETRGLPSPVLRDALVASVPRLVDECHSKAGLDAFMQLLRQHVTGQEGSPAVAALLAREVLVVAETARAEAHVLYNVLRACYDIFSLPLELNLFHLPGDAGLGSGQATPWTATAHSGNATVDSTTGKVSFKAQNKHWVTLDLGHARAVQTLTLTSHEALALKINLLAWTDLETHSELVASGDYQLKAPAEGTDTSKTLAGSGNVASTAGSQHSVTVAIHRQCRFVQLHAEPQGGGSRDLNLQLQLHSTAWGSAQDMVATDANLLRLRAARTKAEEDAHAQLTKLRQHHRLLERLLERSLASGQPSASFAVEVQDLVAGCLTLQQSVFACVSLRRHLRAVEAGLLETQAGDSPGASLATAGAPGSRATEPDNRLSRHMAVLDALLSLLSELSAQQALDWRATLAAAGGSDYLTRLVRSCCVFAPNPPRDTVVELLVAHVLPVLTVEEWCTFVMDMLRSYMGQTPAPGVAPRELYSQESVFASLQTIVKRRPPAVQHPINMFVDLIGQELQHALDHPPPDHAQRYTELFAWALVLISQELTDRRKSGLAHLDTHCQHCKTSPIYGVRYRCGHCLQDVCAKCESQQLHAADHVLIKIPRPLPMLPSHALQQAVGSTPLLPALYSSVPVATATAPGHANFHCEFCGAAPITGVRFTCANCDDYHLCEACELKADHFPEKFHVFLKFRHAVPGAAGSLGNPSAYIPTLLHPALYPRPSVDPAARPPPTARPPLERSLSLPAAAHNAHSLEHSVQVPLDNERALDTVLTFLASPWLQPGEHAQLYLLGLSVLADLIPLCPPPRAVAAVFEHIGFGPLLHNVLLSNSPWLANGLLQVLRLLVSPGGDLSTSRTRNGAKASAASAGSLVPPPPAAAAGGVFSLGVADEPGFPSFSFDMPPAPGFSFGAPPPPLPPAAESSLPAQPAPSPTVPNLAPVWDSAVCAAAALEARCHLLQYVRPCFLQALERPPTEQNLTSILQVYLLALPAPNELVSKPPAPAPGARAPLLRSVSMPAERVRVSVDEVADFSLDMTVVEALLSLVSARTMYSAGAAASWGLVFRMLRHACGQAFTEPDLLFQPLLVCLGAPRVLRTAVQDDLLALLKHLLTLEAVRGPLLDLLLRVVLKVLPAVPAQSADLTLLESCLGLLCDAPPAWYQEMPGLEVHLTGLMAVLATVLATERFSYMMQFETKHLEALSGVLVKVLTVTEALVAGASGPQLATLLPQLEAPLLQLLHWYAQGPASLDMPNVLTKASGLSFSSEPLWAGLDRLLKALGTDPAVGKAVMGLCLRALMRIAPDQLPVLANLCSTLLHTDEAVVNFAFDLKGLNFLLQRISAASAAPPPQAFVAKALQQLGTASTLCGLYEANLWALQQGAVRRDSAAALPTSSLASSLGAGAPDEMATVATVLPAPAPAPGDEAANAPPLKSVSLDGQLVKMLQDKTRRHATTWIVPPKRTSFTLQLPAFAVLEQVSVAFARGPRHGFQTVLPAHVMVQVGSMPQHMAFAAELDAMGDPVLASQKSKSSNSVSFQLYTARLPAQLGPVQYVTVQMARPSSDEAKAALGIVRVSIMGHHLPASGQAQQPAPVAMLPCLQILARLCHPQFHRAQELVVATDGSGALLRLLPILVDQLPHHTPTVKQVLLTFATHSAEFAHRLFEQLLQPTRSETHAALAADLCQQSGLLAQERTLQLQTFVLHTLGARELSDRLLQIEPYLRALTRVFRACPALVSAADVQLLLRHIEASDPESQINESLVKLLIAVIKSADNGVALAHQAFSALLRPGVVSARDVHEYKGQLRCLGLLTSGFTPTAELCLQAGLLPSLAAELAALLGDTQSALSAEQLDAARHMLDFLAAAARNSLVKDWVGDVFLPDLFTMLHRRSAAGVDELPLQRLAVKLLQALANSHPDNGQRVAQLLHSALAESTHETDFLSRVTACMLTAFDTVPVCLIPASADSDEEETRPALAEGPEARFADTQVLATQPDGASALSRFVAEAMPELPETTRWRKVWSCYGDHPTAADWESFLGACCGVGSTLLLIETDKQGVIGGFCAKDLRLPNHASAEPVLHDTQSFLFTLEPRAKFVAVDTARPIVQLGRDYNDGGYVQFGADGALYLSFSEGYPNSCYMTSQFACLEQPDARLPDKYTPLKVEVFAVAAAEPDRALGLLAEGHSPVAAAWLDPQSPLGYHCGGPVFDVPANLPLALVCQHLGGGKMAVPATVDMPETAGQLTTPVRALWARQPHNVLELTISKAPLDPGAVQDISVTPPPLQILRAFQDLGGATLLFRHALTHVNSVFLPEEQKLWTDWLKQLQHWSDIPYFTEFFMNQTESRELLFLVLGIDSSGTAAEAALPGLGGSDALRAAVRPGTAGGSASAAGGKKDKKEPAAPAASALEEARKNPAMVLQRTAVRLLTCSSDPLVRETMLGLGFVQNTLEQLGRVSKVASRKPAVPNADSEPVAAEAAPPAADAGPAASVDVPPAPPPPPAPELLGASAMTFSFGGGAGGGKKKAKKGVGYGSDEMGDSSFVSTWDPAAYIKAEEERNKLMAAHLEFLSAFLSAPAEPAAPGATWRASASLCDLLLHSPLLPILENTLANDSLLDMGKQAPLYLASLELLRGLSQQEALWPLLRELEGQWEPAQRESLFALLSRMNNLARVFLKCLDQQTELADAEDPAAKTGASDADAPAVNAGAPAFGNGGAVPGTWGAGAMFGSTGYDMSEVDDDPYFTPAFSFGAAPPPATKKTVAAADPTQAATNEAVQRLAREIERTFEALERVMHAHERENQRRAWQDLHRLPLPKRYPLLLGPQRFGYMNMKEHNKYRHHYEGLIASSSSRPPTAKLVRLAQELADISKALPVEWTNAIFLRVDETRVDVMKALIIGAQGTPYAGGCFEFDIFCDDSYPNKSPKVNLTTTGSGAVRFNPNLYNCGKVCLSLLGTWRGTATENWDPKISTLLQVLNSIQAMIMTDDIYFNEPGYENSQGTPEGEKANTGYGNIVRYCNVKFAMLEQLRHPSKGFEYVIRQHFYQLRERILEQCDEWIDQAGTPASYSQLVSDHNSEWAGEFRKGPTKYSTMLAALVEELRQELANMPEPVPDDEQAAPGGSLSRSHSSGDALAPPKVVRAEDIVAEAEEDDGHDGAAAGNGNGHAGPAGAVADGRRFDVADSGVKDRWSRYIGAMGVDAVKRQTAAAVLVVGLNGLGAEIAKNVVLSGCKALVLHDPTPATEEDLGAQFLLRPADVGRPRAEASRARLQELNFYVQVSVLDQPELRPEDAAGFTLVIVASGQADQEAALGEYCHAHGIYFICADVRGVFSKIFVDLGRGFQVVDPDGEEAKTVMVRNITSAQPAVVETSGRHDLQDGDVVELTELRGLTALNGTQHRIRVLTKDTFELVDSDTRELGTYEAAGVVRQLKQGRMVDFVSLGAALRQPVFVENYNFDKLHHPEALHAGFAALAEFQAQHGGRLPEPWHEAEAGEVVALARQQRKAMQGLTGDADEAWEALVRDLACTARGLLAPWAAFVGGMVAQEALKALTGKFMPMVQFCYLDAVEILRVQKHLGADAVAAAPPRYRATAVVLGQALYERLRGLQLFMVGAGAVGCELLKNYAMLGIGAAGSGRLVLTDPDVIENSNLNRQFLFRERHLRKPKSVTAAMAAVAMNPELKGRVRARLDKVHEDTEDVFSDAFFQGLDVVTNALDNVKARLYVDARCVANRRPLLEPGTLGPKGHVQVIVPFKTENYGSQADPEEQQDIPFCTLRMFPEEPVHCIEWARDKFGKLFTKQPALLKRAAHETGGLEQEKESLQIAQRLLAKQPVTFADCVAFARRKFQKYFVNDSKQLLHVYPLDAKTKDDKPFWTLPKRPPKGLAFDPADPLHQTFLVAAAVLRAREFGIAVPDLTPDERARIAAEAAALRLPEFVPSDDKAKAIADQVNKTAAQEPDADDPAPEPASDAPAAAKTADQLRLELQAAFAAARPEVQH